ncbi:MAG: hypothetical protein NC432_10575 [Roseburia sp.]|nr:hypothetical protein [Roseburia sp.]MCM1099180.1 hypothetical protein [Ruminococcus flavefaciens]
MKKRSKAVILSLAAVVLLVLLPLVSSFTAQAEEAATYSLKYFSDKGWRCQPGSEFRQSEGDADLNYLNLYLKDGDHIVIYPGDNTDQMLDLSAVKLESLTVHQNATAVIKTNGIKDCYVLAGATCAINGNVTNAYLYDSVTCNFNDNVRDMTFYVQNSNPVSPDGSNIACVGTVGRFYVHSLSTDSAVNTFYNVKTGGTIMQNGYFWMPEGTYSRTPSEEYTSATESSSAPAASTPNAAPTPAPAPVSSSDEYDQVPKTGDSLAYLWLFPAAAVFGACSFILRKKSN